MDAVVVTVALAVEVEWQSALEKVVHMTALQANSRPPHSSRRGMWSCRPRYSKTHTKTQLYPLQQKCHGNLAKYQN